MDVHVPSAVTAGLRRLGVDVITAQEDEGQRLEDEALLTRATELDRVLFTQDDDFLAIAARWQSRSREFSGVLYSHQLGPGIGELVGDLELIAACADQDELRRHVVYLPIS